MTAAELRKVFLEFFKKRGHTIVPSASLVPEGDPTLLFNVAGMVQFKQFYAAKGAIPFTRAASIQKCLRATDLEEVGKTIKHHTFFEMLGNFSFGDYFKNEAIEWAWQFIIEVVKLPKEKLYITVYEEDEESEKIWAEQIGVDSSRIFRLGREDNFWGPAGLTGACGPCTEIHFDLGAGFGCGREDCSPGCDCDRFIEIWNLVFPQFYQDETGNLKPLERKGVDTGMGLERLAMVCQGAMSTYETDLLKPIGDFVRQQAGLDKQDDRSEIAVRVIADHSRALCFAICEGVLPSNEGRGYVIRRILRRAVLRGLDLGIEEPFLYRVVGKVVDVMGSAYPEITTGAEKVALIVKSDEERFQRTLSRGMSIFKQMIDEAQAGQMDRLAGDDIFKLYDTYGFPLEITQELARTHGIGVDVEGFQKAMDDQRERARQRSRIGRDLDLADDMASVPENFVGYETLEVPTMVTRIRRDGDDVEEVHEGEEVTIELERTPFYPEGGGQVSDKGMIVGTEGKSSVEYVRWAGGSVIEHRVRIESGKISRGEGVVAKVDLDHRKATQRNHTATHLLHAALRSLLGGHVRQAGSLVAPDRLRFDFTHYEPLSDDEIIEIEDMVNQRILENIPVRTSIEPFEKARAKGAIALFGEKYGQKVRVVEIENTSCELCGGTHVAQTGDIGSFRIVSESGIAAGVRRIEAVTGTSAIAFSREATRRIEHVSQILRVPEKDLEDGAHKMLTRLDDLERQVRALRRRLAGVEVDERKAQVRQVDSIKVVTRAVEDADVDFLKDLADRVRQKMPEIVVVVGSRIGERVVLVVGVDQKIVTSTGIKASAIAKRLGEMVGGRGGGKDTFAQAGGKDTSKLEEALDKVVKVIHDLIG